MGKKHIARFTLQFDSDNPIHFNAISILNEKERNKANYIAELIWEKEYGKEQEKNRLLKTLIKEALLEVIEENNLLLPATSEKHIVGDKEIVLSDKKLKRDMAGEFNKEMIQGLNAFGIKT